MVAADSLTFIAHFAGDDGRDVDMLRAALTGNDVVLPPIVLVELLSEPALPAPHRQALLELDVLNLDAGYWVRAAGTRSLILSQKLRARLPDTLIAQACIDNDVALITRDSDFRHFAKHCGLKLA